jgi:hypothetical protein
MRKTILTLLGLALLVTATVQFAAAAQNQAPCTAPVTTGLRDSMPPRPSSAAQLVAYSGGYSAPADTNDRLRRDRKAALRAGFHISPDACAMWRPPFAGRNVRRRACRKTRRPMPTGGCDADTL